MLLKKVAALIDQQPRTNSYHSAIILSLQGNMSSVILENCSSFQVAYSNKNKNKVCVREREGGSEGERAVTLAYLQFKRKHTLAKTKRSVCACEREREECSH